MPNDYRLIKTIKRLLFDHSIEQSSKRTFFVQDKKSTLRNTFANARGQKRG